MVSSEIKIKNNKFELFYVENWYKKASIEALLFYWLCLFGKVKLVNEKNEKELKTVWEEKKGGFWGKKSKKVLTHKFIANFSR